MGIELIRMDNVSKSFGRKQVLDNINLSIMKGQSIALLGNNGSGKSTLLRMLCGLTNATSGNIIISSGLKFNYVPEHFPKMNITAKQYIEHMGLIERVPITIIREKSRKLFEAFYMDNMLDVPIKHLSKGTLQKVAVIQTLLTKPDILLLDEPLSGQDLQSQKHFITLMNELKQQDVTIIMSCHEMFLVNQISNIAYQIENKGLESYKITNSYENEFDILIFENRENQIDINHNIIKLVDKTDYNQSEIRFIVKKDKSNDVILQMLKDDYKLLAMKGIEE